MAEEIRVLVVEPLEKPRLVTVAHTLKNLQELAGGTIQAVYPWPEDRVALLCDDEGKFKGYPPNRMLVGEDGEPYDILVGTFFLTGLSEDNFASISDELAEKYTELFYWPEMFTKTMDGHVMWLKIKPGEEPKIIA